MRFDLHQNVMCLLYEHPLLLERCRSWTPKNQLLAAEQPQAENHGPMTTVEPDDLFRFEGEGGLKSPTPGTASIAVPAENAIVPGPHRAAARTASRRI
jgi:hypothetical protein